MRSFRKYWKWWTFPLTALAASAIWFCDPGSSLNPAAPGAGNGKVPLVSATISQATILPDTDTATVHVIVTDSATGDPLSGATVLFNTGLFTLLDATGTSPLQLDTVPAGGAFAFKLVSGNPGAGQVVITVLNGNIKRTDTVKVFVTERPVAPLVSLVYASQIKETDTAKVTVTVLDSVNAMPLQDALVAVSSSFFKILKAGSSDTLTSDTTQSDGTLQFRVLASDSGSGNITVHVTTAAGKQHTTNFTITVTGNPTVDRSRNMVFTVLKPTLKADGSDATQLKVVVKDANNNPMVGEKIVFTATGGLVLPQAVTDSFGTAYGTLVSERANKTVVVTATLVLPDGSSSLTAQQSVTFSGVTVSINTSKKVAMRDSVVTVTFAFLDANSSPMSGDTLDISAADVYRGFGQRLSSSPAVDSELVVADNRGQYQTTVTSQSAGSVIIQANGLGAQDADTIVFTNNSMTLSASKSSIVGNGQDQATLTANLVDGSGNPINSAQLKWTTTFGNFTTTPFTSTSNGKSSIVLQSPNGSGIATVDVEAQDASGALIASGTITVRVTALPVHKLVLTVSPDNIAVKIGQATMTAVAYDSADNVMTGVLIGFRMIKGAGGGDEVISPPAAYTLSGVAQATFTAGGVISLYQGVKLAAVALSIAGNDTLVIASSDTLGVTVSGPPAKVSIGANINKGVNPDDGTFALPVAAVVTDINGNLVADGTPVNFGVIPIAANILQTKNFIYTDTWPYYAFNTDTTLIPLPWTDYNNNGKLDPGEPASFYNSNNPARGEDKDGNGVINFPPETFADLNGDGVWTQANAEPMIVHNVTDSVGRFVSAETTFVDYNHDGLRESMEPFYRNGFIYVDSSLIKYLPSDSSYRPFIPGVTPPCKCAGQTDANGNLYEITYFDSPYNHPFPGDVAVGIDKQTGTLAGKALTKITYVQTDAWIVSVRVTAESNGIRSYVDILPLPKIKEGN